MPNNPPAATRHLLPAGYEATVDLPAEAGRLAEKLEFNYTPKHASWLNMAERDLSVLTRQCLDRRLPTQERVTTEVAAWETRRNAAHAGVTWRFTTIDARRKLARLYPVIA